MQGYPERAPVRPVKTTPEALTGVIREVGRTRGGTPLWLCDDDEIRTEDQIRLPVPKGWAVFGNRAREEEIRPLVQPSFARVAILIVRSHVRWCQDRKFDMYLPSIRVLETGRRITFECAEITINYAIRELRLSLRILPQYHASGSLPPGHPAA